ncbi:hypothetical protein A1351_12925 [Methylosinus sp. R-45379]|uniref:hypothetical protein n=1 Tax=Methylosinus sp. R-45379 TaxID=980563 RepID=UPI0007C8C759|nr:hypothetical protein [Methylosinus sp. R-45379]OAI27389.1 hypothetical protein A1351_12925 [Methylosinus sp. R-45379]
MVYAAFSIWLLYHRAVVMKAGKRVEAIEAGLAATAHGDPEAHDWQLYRTLGSIETKDVGAALDFQAAVPLVAGLVILVVFVLVAPVSRSSGNAVPIESPRCPAVECVQRKALYDPYNFDASFALTLASILAGSVLIGLRKGVAPTTAGFALFAMAGGIQAAVVKNLKVDSFLKANFENLVKAQFELQVPVEPKVGDRFVSTRLGAITNFKKGRASFDQEGFEDDALRAAERDLESICARWKSATPPDGAGVVLIVGATDRLPLSGETKARYEANAGLARARVEAVRARLDEDCWKAGAKAPDRDNIIALVSGPRVTPSSAQIARATRPLGVPSDRRVDIWLMTNTPAAREKADNGGGFDF